MVTLETNRLIVRDYTEADLENLHSLFSDKQNMYFLDDISTNTLEETGQNLTYSMANADGHYFCIYHKETGEYVGAVGYTISAETPLGNVVHLGYVIMPKQQRKGYMTEAVKRVLEFAFNQDGCIRVTTGCYKANEPSRRVMEKVGFRKEGERLKAQYHDGAMKDRLDYAINKDDFLALSAVVKNPSFS